MAIDEITEQRIEEEGIFICERQINKGTLFLGNSWRDSVVYFVQFNENPEKVYLFDARRFLELEQRSRNFLQEVLWVLADERGQVSFGKEMSRFNLGNAETLFFYSDKTGIYFEP